MPKPSTIAFELPKPELVEAEGGSQVDSLKLLGGATVRVCFDGMLRTDKIALRWQTSPGEYAPIESLDGLEEGCIEFHVPPFYVGLLLDNYATFDYIVTREGVDYPSQPSKIRIKRPSNLPAPAFVQSPNNDVLDLSLLCCHDPVVRVAPWVFIDPVQTIRLDITGTNNDETRFYKQYFYDEHVTDDDVRSGWSRSLPLADLRQIKHGSRLTLVFFVAFGGTGSGHSLMLPTTTLTLLNEPHLDLAAPGLKEAVCTEFEGCVVNPVNTVGGAHIVIAYEGICCNDWVCPSFSGTPGPGSPALEGRHVGKSVTQVEFAVPPWAISANFGQFITLAYTVTRCDGSQWHSPEQTVKVLGITGLPKPGIEQATDKVLSLRTFTYDATVRVPRWDYAALGQCIWIWITGTHQDGSAYEIPILTDAPLTADWLASGVYAPISRAELQKLKDCIGFELHAAASFDGKCDLVTAIGFPVETFNIIQEDMELKSLDIREAVGDSLTIINGRYGLTARVAYPGISEDQEVQVNWKLPDDTCLPISPLSGDSSLGYVDCHIPREAVIRASGMTIPISYTVTSACKRQTSDDLNLKVTKPVQTPTPRVLEATQNILDLSTFGGDAHVVVFHEVFSCAWWFALPGQWVWISIVGETVCGGLYSRDLYVGQLTEEEARTGLKTFLPRAELESLKPESTLTVTCEVATDGSNRVDNTVAFPPLPLIVRTIPADKEDFENIPHKLIGEGQSVCIGTMEITHLSGLGRSGIHDWYQAPWVTGNAMVMCLDGDVNRHIQHVKMKFTHACRGVKFGVGGLHYSGSIYFYNEAGNLLEERALAGGVGGGEYNTWVETVAGPNEKIAWIIFVFSDWVYFDNFVFSY